jgi:DNA repair exonuclease SbcCD ATPase subunit
MQSILGTEGYPQLIRVVRYVRNRWRLRNVLKGVAFLILFGLVAFAVSAYGMEQFRYTAWSVRLFRVFTYLALLGLFLRFLYRPLSKRVTDEQVARYMEEHDPSLKEAISTSVEVGRPLDCDTDRQRFVSPALVERLVKQTVERCERIEYGHTIEQDALKRSSAVLFGVAFAGMIAVLLSPGFLRYGASLLLNPLRSAQAASPYAIQVQPGSVDVARGADQLVSAELSGFDSEDTEIAMKLESEGGGEGEWKRWPMTFDEAEGHYAFMMFDLESSTEYFVEANGVRSELFRIAVSDLPYVRQIDLEYLFPEYTGLSPQKVEDGGDVAALRGTKVKVVVHPTVQVPGGSLRVEGKEPMPLEPGESGSLSATLNVDADGFYRIELQGFDGNSRPASPDYAIEVLSDQPPSVSITKPGRDSKVSPIEEVFAEVKAEDDYGLSKVELVYSVNGSEEKVVPLYGGGQKKEMVAGHTFFLEDFGLAPGDFISYFARATDAGGSRIATTDIYFIEARPFDRRYSQAEGGMPGGGGGGGMEGTLSVRQRQIVAATFKLIRDKAEYAKRDWEENLTTIALMQGRLREQVENLLRRMTNRGITEMDGEFATISESLKKALEEMGPAEEKLVAKAPDDALPPEQRALQHLQRADAIFRDVQVSFQSGGGGGGQAASAEDLADLFELELDKLRNQYETVERGAQQSTDNEVDEALQRLQELARRQQQENERLKRQASRLQNQGGGGGGGQQDLADETEELARKLERLAREQSIPKLEDTARRLQQAADSMRRAGARGESGALAEGLSALDKLKDARRLLDKNRSVRLDRDMDDAREQMERIRSQQERVSSEVNRMSEEGAEGGGASGERVQRIFERKDELAEEVANLESQLDRMAREGRSEQKEASRKIQDAANSIRDSKLKEKIRYSKGVVQGRSPEYAQNFEKLIGEDVENLRQKLEDAAGSIGKSEETKVTEAIDQTRDLVRNLESLSERIRERGQQGQQGQQDKRRGLKPGNQGEKSSEGQSSQGESSEGQREGAEGSESREAGSQAGGSDPTGSADAGGGPAFVGSGSPNGPNYQPGAFSTEEVRQLRREFRERVKDAENLRRELARQNLDVPDLGEIIRRMEEFDKKQIFLNPLGLEKLEEDVLADLKQFEYWLRRELEGIGEEQLYLAGSDQVPADYRQLVEEYFRSLSRSKN